MKAKIVFSSGQNLLQTSAKHREAQLQQLTSLVIINFNSIDTIFILPIQPWWLSGIMNSKFK